MSETTTKDTPITPYQVELTAMEQVAQAFDTLTDEQRHRVLWWASQRYRLGMGGRY